MRTNAQLFLIQNEKSAYGGDLLKTRKGRSRPRPLDTKQSMHLNLKSSKAIGEWSLSKPKNAQKIQKIIKKFSLKYGVRIFSMANVGNHLHFHIQLSSRHTYKAFIRAITSAIAMAVTGVSRWKKIKSLARDHFWDRRPFTRVIYGFKGFLTMKDYIQINQLEGLGVNREEARFIVSEAKIKPWLYRPAWDG